MTQRKLLLKQGLWFFLFTALLLLLIASRYFKYFSEVDSFLTVFYLIITTVSHFTALSFILFLLYLPIVLIVPHKTIAWIWAAILASCGCTLLLLDTFVFDLYRMHINSFVLELLFGGAGTQIFEFTWKQYILYVGFILVFFIAMLYGTYQFFRWKRVHSFTKGWWVVVSMVVMMLSSHGIHAWADAASYIPITKSSRYYPLFFPTTNKELMLKLGIVDEIKSKNNSLLFANQEHADLNYPKHPLVADTLANTNIIVILIDSWYYKAFDSITMPHLYQFSKKCSVYNKHYSGSNGTRTGVFSLFYSIPGTYWDIVLATQTSPVFIDYLLKNNYQIKTFASASLASPPFDRTIFRSVKDIQIETAGSSVCDRDIQITKDWMALTKNNSSNSNAKPVFSFLFYDALHAISHPANFKGPYQPEWEYPQYESLDNETDPTPFLNLYKNSANFVDSLVGKVLADLEEKGLLKNSWVIITGDHGQEFNDNKKNYWGHNGNYSAAQMQVPTLIYKPGGKHQVYTHWTSHYDIVPTIMTDLFHCKNPITDYSIGKNMNDKKDRNWLLIGSSDNFAILQPNRINTVNFDGSYDITDQKLNPIKDAKLQTDLINKIMFSSKSFYAK
jgi:membrane-anchored protein YejM (alkaline phosphatase superfamily)